MEDGKKFIANPFVAFREEFDDWVVLFNRIPATISGATFSLAFSLFLSSCLLLTLLLISPGKTYGGQTTLAWDPESASDLAGYKVHYGTVSKNYSFTTDAGTQTTVTVTGLTEGATYYFAATAYNAGGTETAPSNEVTVTVPASCSFADSTHQYILYGFGRVGKRCGDHCWHLRLDHVEPYSLDDHYLRRQWHG